MSDRFGINEANYQAFMKRFEEDFIITMRENIDSGYSGARTSLVQIRPRHPGADIEEGKYILKVGHAESAMREMENHKAAKRSSLLGDYVPNLIEPPIQ
ncbi:MAG TPA: hypothetical protein VEP90_00240 [Methylomirabilota bacterium]|nr:hypothetical protein [Methylomirabilota bacterium]